MARGILFGVALAMTAVAPLAAQNFQGRGALATEKFTLAEGTAVFDVQHRGEGSFLVNLLDDGGNVVEELANVNGTFGDSRSVRIAKSGLYLFDVSATGDWSIRLRRNDLTPIESAESPEAERGRTDGAALASRVSTTGWLARGFLGGVLLGPIGTGVAVAKAGSSAESAAAQAVASQSAGTPDYARGWEAAYLERLRMRRQRSALIGGAVGSGVLLFALLQVVDLGGVTEDDEVGEPSAPIVIPIRF